MGIRRGILIAGILVIVSGCRGGDDATAIEAPSSLSYSQSPAVYSKNIAITPNIPTVVGDAATLYGVTPALPTGLSINTTTGVISGTPTVVSAATNYTVTATNTGGSTTAIVNIKTYFCPEYYVLVPPLTGYTSSDFCVGKYIASNSSGIGVSRAGVGAVPYVNIDRTAATTACTNNGPGFDLITNSEWQTVARNIEGVASNWSGGVIGDAGGLNRGHSDAGPPNSLAASADDDSACSGTLQTCSSTVWNSQRRTFKLNNGDSSNQTVWDFAGNVWQWVKDDNNTNFGSDRYIYEMTSTDPNNSGTVGGITGTAKTLFGPARSYTTLSSSKGGLGYGYINSGAGAVIRGGYWAYGDDAGVFAVNVSIDPTASITLLGFRCVYHP